MSLVIPSEVEESRSETQEVVARDPSTSLRSAQDDTRVYGGDGDGFGGNGSGGGTGDGGDGRGGEGLSGMSTR